MKKHTTLIAWLASLFVSAGPASLPAQTGVPAEAGAATPAGASAAVSSAPNPSDQNEQIVQMSPYEVSSTQGHGYVTTNANQGLKTNEQIMDIPQSILVATNDFIMDVGQGTEGDTTDVMQFLGLEAGFRGEALLERGGFTGYPYVDDLPINQNYEDNFWVDSYTVIKGAAEVLYINGFVNGSVLKTSKRPLPYAQNILTASLDQWGTRRFTLDSTGPIGKIADARILYRIVALDQGGDSYFANVKYPRKGILAELQVKWRNTSVRVWDCYQYFYTISEANAILTPQGGVYSGIGWRNEEYMPPNDEVIQNINRVGIEILQTVSDNWSFRFSAATYSEPEGTGSYVLPIEADWTGQTEQWQAYYENITDDFWTLLGDANGHYKLGPIPQKDAFGFAYSDQLLKEKFWGTSSFGGGPSTNLQVVPFNNAAAVNALAIPAYSDYAYPTVAEGGPESRLESIFSSVYWQHTIEAVPGHLYLVGALTWANIETISNPDVIVVPWQTANISVSQMVHRLAALAKIIPEISVYALTSTTFTPPNGTATFVGPGQAAPPQQGTDDEIGLKLNFFNGRLSGDFAWFKTTLTNTLTANPDNPLYFLNVGSTAGEGVDGDLAFSLSTGWQMIGTFYAGHIRNPFGNPVSGSYDNSWSIWNRYNFGKASPFSGFSVGGGVSRIGGRWQSSQGLDNAFAYETSYAQNTGFIKMKTGTLVDGFISYSVTKRWQVRVTCDNILNQNYPLASQGPVYCDPSPPRTFSFQTNYKF